jgi:hypothetical protein
VAPPASPPPAPAPVPTFSVIIAAYQATGTIGEAVESALSQTVPPLDVVVCDDGSTDDLAAALEPYCERIVLVRQENRGEGAAKNAAARAASGEFVAVLDADDVYLPTRLEALGELAALRPDLDVLTTNAFLELDGRTIGRYYPDITEFPAEDQHVRLFERSSAIFGLAAVRRSTLLEAGGFEEHMRTVADWECWLRLAVHGARFGLVDEPLARYRLRPDSLTADRLGEARGCVTALERMLRLGGLDARQQAVAKRSLRRYRSRALLAAAEAALRDHRRDARTRSMAVAFGDGMSLRTRVKAVVAAVAPRLAAKRLLRRPSRLGRDLPMSSL